VFFVLFGTIGSLRLAWIRAAITSLAPIINCMPEEQPKPKILLLEDEAMLASMYKTKFEREGFEIVVAGDGEEGLEQAKAASFDVVLIDIIMPKLDGFAVLKQLRLLDAYKDVPILMLTNLGQEEDVEKGKALGATDYLVKANFTPSQVLEKIRAVSH